MMSYVKRTLIVIITLFSIVALGACGSKKIESVDYSKEQNWVDIEKCGTKSTDVFHFSNNSTRIRKCR